VKILTLPFSEFLSNIGGFMGLLAGISFLSVVEVFYHLATVRSGLKVTNQVHPLTQANRQVGWANENHALYQLMKYFMKYVKSSDVHGLSYVQDRSLGKFSRLFWIVLVALSLLICSTITIDVYNHVEKSPVVTRIDPQFWTLNDVREIKFACGSVEDIETFYASDSVSYSVHRTTKRL
jgi:Amiloride-sensitive sodium channel